MEFRKTDQYAQWMSSIRKDYPHLFKEQIDMIIFGHMSDPQAYKRDKSARGKGEVDMTPIMPTKGQGGEFNGVRIYSGVDDPNLPYVKPAVYSDGVAEPHMEEATD